MPNTAFNPRLVGARHCCAPSRHDLIISEIGKPYAQALTDIDRCISGVEWYVENISGMLAGRAPLGLISNIASWNRSLRFGNPVLVESPADPFPKLDFGPLINSTKVEELRVLYVDALGKGLSASMKPPCRRA